MFAVLLPAFAEDKGTIRVHLEEAGTLSTKLEELGINVKTVTDLVITGTINQEDFRVMSKIMTALMYVDISGTDVISIPDNAFDGKNVLQKCMVPEGLQMIGNYAFRNSGLTNLPFGKQITSIGNNAFDGCYSLKGDIVFTETLSSIGDGAFQNCNLLTSVDMSQYKGYQIPNSIFQGCSSIRKVILPDKGTVMMPGDSNSYYTIGWGAFYDTGITEITIPAAVSSINSNAFNCYQLKTINMLSVTPPSIEEYTFSSVDKTMCILNVPTGSIKAYSYASNWSAFSNIEEIGIQTEASSNGSILYNGEILKNGNVIFHNAQEATFTLIPDPGYTVDKVIFNKKEVTVENNTIKIGTDTKSGILNVSFVLKKFNLNVTTEGKGKVKYNNEYLSEQQTILVDSASSTKFILEPEDGYAIKTILYNKMEGVAQQDESVYTTPFAKESATLIITFASKEEIGKVHKISIKTGANGNILYKNTPLLQESNITVKEGAITTFAITPDRYYMVEKVLYNQEDVTESVSKEGIFTTETINADAVLEVSFKLNPVITVNVEEPESLKSLLTEEQLGVITHLTLTGSLTISDFNTMRDDMLVLSVIDMSQATIAFGGATGNDIPYNAFSTYNNSGSYIGKKTLTEIKLPINIQTIGGNAFENCINLKKVNFEECTSLNSINESAFKGTGLTTIDLSQTKITSLVNNQFAECKLLQNVVFPATLESIGSSFNNSSIQSIDLSVCTKMTQIQGSAFYSCPLTEIKFPSSLEAIGPTIVYDAKLKSLDLSNCTNLKTIGESAFFYSQLLEDVKFPASLEQIGNGAFSLCKLTSVDLSKCTALTQIGTGVFSSNSTLKTVKLPATLVSIANNAFESCGLTGTLELPATLTTIGERAFSNNNFTICKIAAAVPPTLGKYVFGGDPMMGNVSTLTAIFVPENSVKAYKNANGWNEYTILGGENRVDVNVTKPGNLAIDIMEQAEVSPALVTHLTVHGTLNSKDFGVMRSNMTVLYSIDLSDADAEIIPQEAFRDKSILMEFKAPRNLSIIESQAFSGCTTLSGTFELPDGVTTINNNAFSNCSSLTGIKFSKNLLRIGSEAFSNCTNLTQEIIFPNKLRTIESNAFNYCHNLFGTITLPSSLESLGYSSFRSCSNLQRVDMTACSSLTEIQGETFNSCSNLEEILLPEKLQYIRDNTFAYCLKLDNLKFPVTLYSIGNSAFNGCNSLSTLDLSACNLLNAINDYAFSNCASLATINLPSSLTSIGGYAFSQCRTLANISATNIVPAHLGDYVFQRVNTEVCILSIPTDSYYDYLTAEQWGAFVQMRKAIAISMNDKGGKLEYINNANIEDEDEANTTRTARLSRMKANSTEKKGAIATDGSSIYVKKNETVSFFISPKVGYEVEKVLYNDKDVTSEVINGIYTTPKVNDKANLNVSFSSTTPEITGVTLNKNTLTLAISETEILIATISPAEVTNKSIIWTSSNPEIATVDDNGLVTAIKVGTTQITATTVDGGFTATCEITVHVPVGINSATVEELAIHINNNSVIVSGAESGIPVSVYTISGALISTQISKGTDLTFYLPTKRIYLIRANDHKPVKIVL